MFDPLKAKTRVLLYSALAVTLGIGGASALGWTSLSAMPTIRQEPVLTDEQIRPALDLSEAFINISEAVTPAVVRIEAERPAQMASTGNVPIPEEFRDFFGPFNQQPQSPTPVLSGGSGFIISSDGFILTNNHVVANATRLRVFLRDRREYAAEVIGTDPTTDVAIIKIDDTDLPTLSLGSSDAVRVGEWVLAVGNPGFGGGSSLDYTVTSGIVSAIGRPLDGLIDGELEREGFDRGFGIESFIQTDAVINPGNSGGPLVNLRGQVVGINSAIASQTGYYQGYGFAIPIDLAQRVTEDLIEYGEVRRAYLGIRMTDVSSVDAEYYGLPRTMGAKIDQAVEGSPAAEAGLRQEDVVVAVDGVDIDLPSDLQLLIAQRRPGDEVDVTYYRNQERRETTIRLGTAPLAAAIPEPEVTRVSSQARIGIDVLPLGEAEAEQFGFDAPGGIVIGGVAPAGPALRAGVIPGEKLLAVNRQNVETVEDVEALLGDLSPGEIVSLRLGAPDGSSRVVNLRVPE